MPICDGHDSAINTINLELIRHGIEVVYLGYHRSARDMVRAAIQEDVRAIGISSYNGGHVEFFTEVVSLLRKHGAGDIGVFGGGGGTITHGRRGADAKNGVDRIFFAGTPLSEMLECVRSTYAPRTARPAARTASTRIRPTGGSRSCSAAAESAATDEAPRRTTRPPARASSASPAPAARARRR